MLGTQPQGATGQPGFSGRNRWRGRFALATRTSWLNTNYLKTQEESRPSREERRTTGRVYKRRDAPGDYPPGTPPPTQPRPAPSASRDSGPPSTMEDSASSSGLLLGKPQVPPLKHPGFCLASKKIRSQVVGVRSLEHTGLSILGKM
ncbi:uncharacterized protein LOC121829534 isoform X2 [Peromyscus maniculatus bairdii]|uniref:uncharacterized protein LOC121829534 isoform X2 n=1 Tax=Peromyscus maniculatus bairdii TaxID=230844 RepID=UPI003FD384B9